MTDSKRVAGLVGPTTIAVALSEVLNLQGMIDNPASYMLVYLNGTLLFVAGLAIVRAHNRWTAGWPVLVTLIGWFIILFGLFRMFAPATAQQEVHQNTTHVYAMLIVLLAIGIVLTFKAYGREGS